MARWRALPAFPLLLAMLITACDGTAAEGVRVVATTTILGDVVRNVVGDGAAVEVLIPLGADPHDYQASSQQVAAIRRADLVIANGLGLEEGLSDILESLAADGANVVEIAPQLDPIAFGDEAGADPHVWFDPIRMADAAGLIAAEMAAVDPHTDWAARADAYRGALRTADQDITAILRPIPEAGRVLVTNHDALGYFALRYGFEVAGTVIPAGTTLAEPSSAALAALVAEIESRGVRAIFAETTEPLALADAIAAEVGDGISVVELYTGSLGAPGSGADTLVGMLLTDARRIAGALG